MCAQTKQYPLSDSQIKQQTFDLCKRCRQCGKKWVYISDWDEDVAEINKCLVCQGQELEDKFTW